MDFRAHIGHCELSQEAALRNRLSQRERGGVCGRRVPRTVSCRPRGREPLPTPGGGRPLVSPGADSLFSQRPSAKRAAGNRASRRARLCREGRSSGERVACSRWRPPGRGWPGSAHPPGPRGGLCSAHGCAPVSDAARRVLRGTTGPRTTNGERVVSSFPADSSFHLVLFACSRLNW